MRILMVYNDYQQPGGEKVAFHNECNLLREKGHEVEVYTRSNDEVEGMNPLKMLTGMIWNRQAYSEIRELIRQHKIEVMHVHNVHLVISPSIFHAATAEGIPSIFTLHNFRLLCPAANLFRNAQLCEDCIGKAIAIDGIVHKCYRERRSTTAGVAAMQTFHRIRGTWRNQVTRFIALTEFTRSKYIAGGLPEERIVIKPNFLDNPQEYAWEPDRDTPYALCVGRLCQGKGVHVLLEAWRQNHPGIGLKIVGSGETEYELRKQGEGLEGVEFMNQLDHSEVFDLLRHATLFLMPSIYYECNPFALIESQAIGTPAVVSAHGSMNIMVRDGESGWHATAGDPDAWSEAIRTAVEDTDRLTAVSHAARAEYERVSDREASYKRTIEIYQEAIEEMQTK